MINIGLIGAGTIGSGVIYIYKENFENLSAHAKSEIRIKTICDLDFEGKESKLSDFQLTSDYNDIVNDPEINIIVELIGGEEPAKTIIKNSLLNGKSVVTANKLVMAKYGKELLSIANENRVDILYEAAVGGAIPIINPLKSTLVPNKIQGIFGIVNGTTNYILSKMQDSGANYLEILKEAQNLGYAEADPSSDVDGLDSQYKLAILASIAFRADIKVDDILVEGISQISTADIDYIKELGMVVKLLAIAKVDGERLELRVHPVILEKKHPLASVNDVYNAVYVIGNAVGDLMFYGQGAGSIPTASSIWADILDLVNDTPYKMGVIKDVVIKPIGEIASENYFRFRVEDQPGVLADIAGIFAENSISIKSAIQKGFGSEAELVVISHLVTESNKEAAIKKIKALDGVKDVCSIIRAGI